ncbi:MAG TPA: hypothetical protein PLD62_10160, partial [Candidatus Cloacimonadota bacterium]|nr:hypothetical protein [Candidatus Cloacimonadota bacterium]
MKKLSVLILLVVCAVLSAQFSEPVHVNETWGTVFYRGSDACKIIGDAVYMTFVESETGNLFFAYAPDAENFSLSVVETATLDEFDKPGKMLLPSIEVAETGEIDIFFMRETESTITLHKAFSDDDGQSFTITEIASNVSAFSSCSRDNEILLNYQQGTSVPLSVYQYFTNYERSENDEVIRFYGLDQLEGYVHSNDDIWVRNIVSWPSFSELLTTSKRINSGTAPAASELENIFPNGYLENVQKLNHSSTAAIAMNGTHVGMGFDIVYMKIDESSIQTMYGIFVNTGVQDIPVYSWYPHDAETANAMAQAGNNWFEDSDVVWTNEVTMWDTIWTAGPTLSISQYGSTYYIPDGELWIEGTVNGKLTVGCANNVYLVGDITYSNTTPGMAPDDPDNPNTTDYFGLVSEEKMIIKYKHRDPFNDLALRADNCNDIILYGAYAALGDGSPMYGNYNSHYEGVFSFEYQHPHGSTPDFVALSPYTLTDTLYTFVDLHKYIFPFHNYVPFNIEGFTLHGNEPLSVIPCCGFPYESAEYLNSYPNNSPNNYVFPYGTDYPWYNPVWPESSEDIVFSRGTISLWGSIAQTRRGFIHRSGCDPYNHPGDNKWDLDETTFHYDGTHAATGYEKDYHYDTRFQDNPLSNYPMTNGDVIPHLVILQSENAGLDFEEIHNVETENEIVYFLDIDVNENIIMMAAKTRSGYSIEYSIDDGVNFDTFVIDDLLSDNQFIDDIYVDNGKCYINTSLYQKETVLVFDPLINEVETLLEDNASGYVADFAVGNGGCKIYVSAVNGNFEFQYSGEDLNVLSQTASWSAPISINYMDGISINFNAQDSVFVTLLNTDSGLDFNADGELYFVSGTLENLLDVPQNELTPVKIHLNSYPNPFNPSTTITFSVPQTA